jgi:hypothetical protein
VRKALLLGAMPVVCAVLFASAWGALGLAARVGYLIVSFILVGPLTVALAWPGQFNSSRPLFKDKRAKSNAVIAFAAMGLWLIFTGARALFHDPVADLSPLLLMLLPAGTVVIGVTFWSAKQPVGDPGAGDDPALHRRSAP